nr:putative ribonuclease H-like domain-containing protein [Tanacetum cinerariifolium]
MKRELKVSCYTDAGYLTDADDLKSQTGYVFVLNGEAVWIQKFIFRLDIVLTIKEPIKMYYDNIGAITIAKESGITKGARHYRAKVHYLQEVIEYGDHMERQKERHGYGIEDWDTPLLETGMLDCKPAKTPMMSNQKLYMETEAKLADRDRYQRLVGKLIYLSHTRSDIAYAVGVVSQFMHQPQATHINAVLRIIRYLKGTTRHMVLFKSNGHLNIRVYTNADRAGDKGNRRSTSGYFSLVGDNLVTWKSKKQKVVSLSSVEAELRGISRGLAEVLWIRKLLTEVGFPPKEATQVMCDNEAAI